MVNGFPDNMRVDHESSVLQGYAEDTDSSRINEAVSTAPEDDCSQPSGWQPSSKTLLWHCPFTIYRQATMSLTQFLASVPQTSPPPCPPTPQPPSPVVLCQCLSFMLLSKAATCCLCHSLLVPTQPPHSCRWATSCREEGDSAIIDYGW